MAAQDREKAGDASCPHSEGQTEGGEHTTFRCPKYHRARRHLGPVKSWEDLDKPIRVENEEGHDWDVVEEFSSYQYRDILTVSSWIL